MICTFNVKRNYDYFCRRFTPTLNNFVNMNNNYESLSFMVYSLCFIYIGKINIID